MGHRIHEHCGAPNRLSWQSKMAILKRIPATKLKSPDVAVCHSDDLQVLSRGPPDAPLPGG